MTRIALSRRRFLGALAGASVVGPLASCSESSLDYALPETPARDRGLVEPTPSCAAEPREATARVIEGPFYLPRTPERQDLAKEIEEELAARAAAGEEGVDELRGQPVFLVGAVLDRQCKPIGGAVLDFWQADPQGQYDEDGMRFRGHQFTDAMGGYRLNTWKPGRYQDRGLDRVPHLHVKVQGPGTRLLTTQLYFSTEPGNEADSLYEPATEMEVVETARGILFARFDFVLDA